MTHTFKECQTKFLNAVRYFLHRPHSIQALTIDNDNWQLTILWGNFSWQVSNGKYSLQKNLIYKVNVQYMLLCTLHVYTGKITFYQKNTAMFNRSPCIIINNVFIYISIQIIDAAQNIIVKTSQINGSTIGWSPLVYAFKRYYWVRPLVLGSTIICSNVLRQYLTRV